MKRISNKTIFATSCITGFAIGVTSYLINKSVDKTAVDSLNQVIADNQTLPRLFKMTFTDELLKDLQDS